MKDFLQRKLAEATKESTQNVPDAEASADDDMDGLGDDDDENSPPDDDVIEDETDPAGEPEGESIEESEDAAAEGDEEPDASSEETDESPAAETTQDEEQVEEAPAAEDPRLLELQRQNALLLQAVIGKQQQDRRPPAPPEDDLPESLLQAVMFGDPNDPAILKAFPAPQVEKAKALALREARDRVRYAKNPNLLMEERILPALMPEIYRMMQPLVDNYQEQQAAALQRTRLEPIQDPVVRARAIEIWSRTPGARSPNWADRDASLDLAVKAAIGERAAAQAQERAQKTRAGKAQAAVNGGKKLKSGAPTQNVRGKAIKLPDMKDNESAAAYYRRNKHLFDQM